MLEKLLVNGANLAPRICSASSRGSARQPRHVGGKADRSRCHLVVAASVEPNTCVTVCQAKDCRRRGSKRVLELFRKLAPEAVEVQEEMCFDECGMGPNVQLGGSGRIVNGVSSMQEVADLLARECVDGEEALEKLAAIQAQQAEAQ